MTTTDGTPTASSKPASARLVSLEGARQSIDRARQSAALRTGAERSSLMWQAYSAVQQRIIKLELPPGTPFTEGELAAQLGMSKTPVREALLLLSSAGLVYPRAGTGYRVSPITLKDARSLFRVRAMLEGEAAALAARRKIDSRVALELEDLAEITFDPGDPASIDYYLTMHTRFHILAASECGNEHLTRSIARLWAEAERLLRFVALLGELPLDDNTADHHRLIAAITKGDPAAAREAAVAHVTTSEQVIVDALLSSDAIQDANVARVLGDQAQA